jgi:hypothetical protein
MLINENDDDTFLLLRQTPLFSQIKDNTIARIEKGNEDLFENSDKIISEGRMA